MKTSLQSLLAAVLLLCLGARVSAQPVITSQPQDVITNSGTSARFSVGVTGATPLYYMWWFTGSNNPTGYAGPNYTLTAYSYRTGGYYCVISNYSGVVTSRVATLALQPTTPTPPSIFTQPVNFTTNVGGLAQFTVAASGSSTLTYRWWSVSSNAIVGTSATLSLLPVQYAQAGDYYCVVSNIYGLATSSVATLTVTAPVAPTITQQPVSWSTNASQSVQFKVIATGSAPLTYRWYNSAGTVVSSSATYTISSVATNQAGDYYVTVSNSVGSVTSSVVTLTVLPFTPTLRFVRHTTYEGDLLYLILQTGNTYQVQSSPNTADWTDFTNFTCTKSPMYLTNRATTNSVRLYYRLLTP